jgi:hypothetical protein
MKVTALLAAGLCMLACATPASAADNDWGTNPAARSASWLEFRAALNDLGEPSRIDKVVTGSIPQTSVVALDVGKDVPSLPLVPVVEDVNRALQARVASSPAAMSKLRAKGYDVEDVLGATRKPDGSMTVFVARSN